MNMHNKIYKLTDIMAVIKLDGTVSTPTMSAIPQLESPDEDSVGLVSTVSQNKHAESIDKQIFRDFMDDGGSLLNASQNVLINRIRRYQNIVEIAKEKYDFECQLCNATFTKDNGEKYCEAHHITPIALDGSQDENNILILCANHHKMFHYAKNRIMIEELGKNKRRVSLDGCHIIIDCN